MVITIIIDDNKTINVNSQSPVEFKGFTAEDLIKAIDKAKNEFDKSY